MTWNETMVATSGMKLLGQVIGNGAGSGGLVILTLGIAAGGYLFYRRIQKLEYEVRDLQFAVKHGIH